MIRNYALLILLLNSWAANAHDCSIEEAPQAEIQAVQPLATDSDLKIKLRNGLEFNLSPNPPVGKPQISELFNKASAEDKAKFYIRRKQFLSAIAYVIAFPRPLRGMGLWTWQKIKGCFGKSEPGSPRELSYKRMVKILDMFDQRIWQDYNLFRNIKAVKMSGFYGTGWGAMLVGYGGLWYRGYEIDVRFDFQTHKFKVIKNSVSQKIGGGLYCQESSVHYGGALTFEVDELPTQISTQINMPVCLMYRSGQNSAGVGLNGGFNFLNFVSLGLFVADAPMAGWLTLMAANAPFFISLYWTDFTKTVTSSFEAERASLPKFCETILSGLGTRLPPAPPPQ